jgi:hypothetical protein
MLARRSNRAVVSMAAWVAATCGLALASACTDGATADCSDAQCQAVVEVIDTGAGASPDSGVDADATADEDSSAGPDADSSTDAGADADSSADADAADGARE